jgi:hypothetical protein
MSDETTSSGRDIDRLGTYPEAAVPEVGQWLWGMQAVRRGLLNTLDRIEKAGFGQQFLDWRGPDGNDNSVGTLLYHVAGVEMGWLYCDMLMTGFPDEVQAWFPLDDRDETGRLRFIPGLGFEEHRTRLARTRERFLEVVAGLSLEDWRRLREPEGEDYAVTPGWIVFHLLEHEAGHLYEIRRLVRKWREADEGGPSVVSGSGSSDPGA